MLTAKEVFAWLDHVMVIQFESGEHHLSCQEAAQMPLQCGYSALTCNIVLQFEPGGAQRFGT